MHIVGFRTKPEERKYPKEKGIPAANGDACSSVNCRVYSAAAAGASGAAGAADMVNGTGAANGAKEPR